MNDPLIGVPGHPLQPAGEPDRADRRPDGDAVEAASPASSLRVLLPPKAGSELTSSLLA
jgi:hypothetical protein